MTRFLENYVHCPVQALLEQVPPAEELPEMTLRMERGRFTATLLGETLSVTRTPRSPSDADTDPMPDDVVDQIPGP